MKRELAVCFIAAVVFHSLLLFAIHPGTRARPLALSDEAAVVDVNLVAAAPAPAAAEQTAPAEPEQTPEPVTPPSTPEPVMPEPTPDVAPPTPEPTPVPQEAVMSTPAPEQPHRNPRPHASLPHTSEKTTAHSHASTAAGVAEPGGTIASGAAVSSRPRYLSNPKPEYPSEARLQHQEGSVLLSVQVSSSGRATEVTLKRSSGFPLLDRSAIEAVGRWTFQPAQMAGLSVSSRVDVPVRFSLSDSRR